MLSTYNYKNDFLKMQFIFLKSQPEDRDYGGRSAHQRTGLCMEDPPRVRPIRNNNNKKNPAVANV